MMKRKRWPRKISSLGSKKVKLFTDPLKVKDKEASVLHPITITLAPEASLRFSGRKCR